MTDDASSCVPSERCSTNGAASRPAVRTLSKPGRTIAVAATRSRRCGAIAGCAASGARYKSMSSAPVGNVSGSGARQPVGSSSARASGSMSYRHGLNSRTCPQSAIDGAT